VTRSLALPCEEASQRRFYERFAHLPGEPSPDTFFLCGIDRTTGERVAIARRGPSWPEAIVTEAIARRVATVHSPSLARVLHAGPHVVFAAPPPASKRRELPPLGPAEIAELALLACEVAAALHAAGVAGLPFSDGNPRITRDRGRLLVHWIVPARDLGQPFFTFWYPGSFRRGRPNFSLRRSPEEAAVLADPVKRDLWGLVHFFFTLRPAEPCSEELDAMRRASTELPPSVASLARTLVATAPSPALTARAAAIPDIASVPRFLVDWDAVIAEGEARLSEQDPRVAEPLADAYHQRASRRWAAGEREAALRDAERAITLDSDWVPYRTTCAILLEGLGRHRAAQRVLIHGRGDTGARARLPLPLAPVEDARMHTTRGLISLRQRKATEAEKDLSLAFKLAPTAFHAHALGAARYALGELQQAAEIEQRSVELDPACSRYRWALVVSLLALGRDDEARAHAQEILAREPGDGAHRERFARLFDAAARPAAGG
jgi:tetratricopeptide (TPR) repeat protein